MLHRLKQGLKRVVFATITGVLGDKNQQVLLTTLTGPARGLRFRLNLRQFIEPLYFYGTYELCEARAIERVCQQGWVVWDCGIYLGYYTNLFSRLVGPKGRVVAFEPDPGNIERTRGNLALNNFGNVQFVQAAIGAPVGEIDFVISHNTNSHIQGAYIGTDHLDYATRERTDEVIKVRCMSLDEAYRDAKLPRPDLIKIDIEGAELEALQYLDKITTEVRPVIILELHNPECDAAAWEFSQRANYSLESLDRGVPVRSREETGGTLLCVPR
jgi:FkbM family methyltransferase